MTVTECDAIVIGAGQPGPGVAGWLAGKGKRVVLIEMEKVGGTCLNHGCKPTKALRASARDRAQVRRAGEYARAGRRAAPATSAAMDRVWSIIDGMRIPVEVDRQRRQPRADPRHSTLVTDRAGVAHRVTIGDRELQAPEVYLNLGARAVVPPVLGLDSVSYLTEVELLALRELPAHLIIAGGSYIGLEFGQMFRRFGSEVTIITGDGVAPREDADVSAIVSEMLTDEGVKIIERGRGRGEPARVRRRGHGRRRYQDRERVC
jgi:pyruvate/2-oxoglutarate dehydrogenase complex dihydrolipoamide dehydrogenase (E3) component